MARRQSGVDSDALSVLITDAIMRAIVPALNQRIEEQTAAALDRCVGPLCDQIAVMAAALTEAQAGMQECVSVAQLEQRQQAAREECQRLCADAVASAIDQVQPFKYCGPHDHTLTYEINHCVTQRGSLWIARQHVPIDIAPGTDAGASFWTLAVKCGRDARGA